MEQSLQSRDAQNLADSSETLTKQLMISSQKTYKRDILVFYEWLTEQQLTLHDLTYTHMVAYRDYLTTRQHKKGFYAKSTVSRLLTVARSVLREAVRHGMINSNPSKDVNGFHLDNESPRQALSKEECKQLLDSLDTSTPRGKRDYALLSLLIRTGIRRAEVVNIDISHFGSEGGHYTLTIPHGKGDKRRIVKIPPDLYRAIQTYLLERGDILPDAPLFVGISKSGKWNTKRLHMYGGLNYILAEHARAIGKMLTPHDLRATFATLALEERAPLQKVQYAMGHSDPRTTERYHRKKLNLDDNAVDYIKGLESAS